MPLAASPSATVIVAVAKSPAVSSKGDPILIYSLALNRLLNPRRFVLSEVELVTGSLILVLSPTKSVNINPLSPDPTFDLSLANFLSPSDMTLTSSLADTKLSAFS